MFVTTFYSFKGGVGRTMALMNVACELAKQRKVLVVDFDLEAPGITTFSPCSQTHGKPGLVEFLVEYLATNKAPLAADYIHRCSALSYAADMVDRNDIASSPPMGELFVMPAGSMQSAYKSKFGQIDWTQLYLERNGFLLMEDLKAQWRDLGFDYVMVDSRTGHSDSSGICTRQLPDAVVVVFFPNEENLYGLTSVVDEIRTQSASKSIGENMLFVSSRIPRLDDEFGQLDSMLRKFRAALGYTPDKLLRVHNYDSLALLEQDVFVCSRPRTRLAAEYKRLARAIVSRNIADPDGAEAFLDNIATRTASGEPTAEELVDFAKIREVHQQSASVMLKLALQYYAARELDLAADAVEAAWVANPSEETLRSRILGLRIRLYRTLSRTELACDSAEEALKLSLPPRPLLLDALRTLLEQRASRLQPPSELGVFRRISVQVLIDTACALDFSRPAAQYGALMISLRLGEVDLDASLSDAGAARIVIALIAGGLFSEASEFDQRASARFERYSQSIQHHFNYAMAEWGKNKVPTFEHFDEVRRRFEMISNEERERHSAANFLQCIALTYGVVGEEDAAHQLLDDAMRRSRSLFREFSCWTYLMADRTAFERDCISIKRYIDQREGVPAFVQTARLLDS